MKRICIYIYVYNVRFGYLWDTNGVLLRLMIRKVVKEFILTHFSLILVLFYFFSFHLYQTIGKWRNMFLIITWASDDFIFCGYRIQTFKCTHKTSAVELFDGLKFHFILFRQNQMCVYVIVCCGYFMDIIEAWHWSFD